MKGSCLCGQVSYEINEPIKTFQYCHCSRCRKFTGSAHAANFFVPPTQFKWLTGEELVGRFEQPDAKYFATSFCKNCGSSLPWATQGGANIVVPAGTLDDELSIKPQRSIFWQSRAPWYEETCDLPKHDTRPVKNT